MSRKKKRSGPSAGGRHVSGTAELRREHRKPAATASTEAPGHQPIWSSEGLREVVESVVIAFVLAFLFRTFEAEAFVIPTGSMAPTLMGRHKDVECPKCGYPFQVSASDEIDSRTGRLNGQRVTAGICPICRYTIDFRPSNSQQESYRSYKGDRILVTKFTYRLSDPKRWDVAVFKYPGEAQTNFIKRIVGLPNETIAISDGDLYVKPADPEDFTRFGEPYYGYGDASIDLDEFRIARKPPAKVRAMLQPVHDNDRVPPEFHEAGWPARWAPWPESGEPAGWQTADRSRSFHTDGSAEGETWIAYRHIVPSASEWEDLAQGRMPEARPDPQPQLISDFSAYNTDHGSAAYGLTPSAGMLGLHWVGDLAVECTVDVEKAGGEALLELVEGGTIFQCRIDLQTGKATLSVDGLDGYQPTASTALRRPGTYRLMFANVDDQLLLWVDGRVVCFDGETGYPRLDNTLPQEEDLRPVRIGSRGAALQVDHLKVYRDVYYIAQRLSPRVAGGNGLTDFERSPYSYYDPGEVARVLSDPSAWGALAHRRRVAFPLADDQFLVLGDNSAESKDSRLWENEGFPFYVSRELLMGKALFIYWPHSLDTIPGTSIPVRFFPNFWRMHFVR